MPGWLSLPARSPQDCTRGPICRQGQRDADAKSYASGNTSAYLPCPGAAAIASVPWPRPTAQGDGQRRQSQPALASRLGTGEQLEYMPPYPYIPTRLRGLPPIAPAAHNGSQGLPSCQAGRQPKQLTLNPAITPCNRKVYAHCDSDIREGSNRTFFCFSYFLANTPPTHRLSICCLFLHALEMPAPGLPRSHPPLHLSDVMTSLGASQSGV